MRSLMFFAEGVAALFWLLAGSASAQPTLQSSLTDWGNISIFGPAVTRSGGAKTEIIDQRTTFDHDGSGSFNPPIDGQLVQNVWTEASVIGGAPVFRSYHDLKGTGIPLYNGVGWTGFRTDATYKDTWTLMIPGLAAGAILSPVFGFGLTSRLGDLFPPGGSIALPPDFYPYNPLWGDVPPGVPVVGPLPSAPSVDLFMSVHNNGWYDYKNTQSNRPTAVAMGGQSISAGFLTVENGVPFDVEISFVAGWKMEHAEIVSLLGASTERFSTNAVFDAAHTGVLSAISVYDSTGSLQANLSLKDSQGTLITPVPEPETYAMILVGLGLVGFAARRRKRA